MFRAILRVSSSVMDDRSIVKIEIRLFEFALSPFMMVAWKPGCYTHGKQKEVIGNHACIGKTMRM